MKTTLIIKTPTQISSLSALCACFLLAPLHAVEITYVGHQVDIEDKANTPAEGWRNPKPAKPLDIDGDHILGTDGWYLSGTTSNPSYAKISVVAPNGNSSGGWGLWDNPADPSGEDTFTAGILHAPAPPPGKKPAALLQFVIRGNDLDGRTLRVGILYDVISAAEGITFTLSHKVGGSVSVTTPGFTTNGTALDVAFFDTAGATHGAGTTSRSISSSCPA
jgi:hypothetical protein